MVITRNPGGDGIPTDFYHTALKEKQCLEEWRKEQEAKQRAAGGVAGSTLGRRVRGETDLAQASASRAGDGGARNYGTRDGGASTHGTQEGTQYGGARNSTTREDSNGDNNTWTGDEEEQEPSLLMGTALLNLLNCAWSTGTVVDNWVESIVICLNPRGDLCAMPAYYELGSRE